MLSILHIDTEKTWRGGQQQAIYLHQGLVSKGITSIFACNKNSALSRKCRELNLPYFEQRMLGELDIIAGLELSKLAKRLRINIIHAHSAHALTIAVFTKFFNKNIKIIAARRVDFSVNKGFLSKWKYNNKYVDKIVCISEFIKNVLKEDGIDKNKLITIRSGVDLNKFSRLNPTELSKKDLGISINDFLFGTVSALVGHKDIPNLLSAFKIVKEKTNNTKLCIVGDGKLKEELIDLSKKLNISDDVFFMGYQKDVGKYLSLFDVYVMSSKKEGLGTSIIDALALGKPIIATNAGGIPELINSGVNGLLVEKQNPTELADAMIKFYENENLRENYSHMAKISAENYSVEKTIEKNIELYEFLVERN